jgi:DNA-binding response OmpR family regulator
LAVILQRCKTLGRIVINKTEMLKILVVDDDKDLLEMVTLVLRIHGMDVFSVNDHQQFFPALQDFRPDLVVLDIYLEEADGRELCRQMKTDGNFRTTPVLLYSAGHISPTSIEECQANGFLQKPFDISILLKRIREQFPASAE